MNRMEFEALRDLAGKTIQGDIRLSRSQRAAPNMIAEVEIATATGECLQLNINYNLVTRSKTFNVSSSGAPICRLDVDGHNHPPAGRQHKHSLQTERCPGRNLPDAVQSRADLAGKSFREVFAEFCRIAKITHNGTLFAPDEGGS